MRRFLLAATLLAAACGDRAPAPTPDTPPAVPPPALNTDSLDAALLARGQVVFDGVCTECHALEPPVKTAPTIREIADRYREAFLDADQALDHLAEYIREPSVDRSQLPLMHLDEWGVMPPQALDSADLRAVALYVWRLR